MNSSMCDDDTSPWRIGRACVSISIAIPRASPPTSRATAAKARTAQPWAAAGAGIAPGPRLPCAAKRAAKSSAIVPAPSTFSFAAVLMVW